MANGASSTNGLANGHINGFTNGYTNGTTNGHSSGETLNGELKGHSNGSTNGTQNGTEDHLEQNRAGLFVLSSFDETTGKQQVQDLQHYLDQRREISDSEFLDNLAYTINERRTHHIWKAAVVARSAKSLSQSLADGVPFKSSGSGTKKRKVGFVFTGQGAQWCGMGKELISTYPLFRASLEKTNAALKAAGAPFDVISKPFSRREDSISR